MSRRSATPSKPSRAIWILLAALGAASALLGLFLWRQLLVARAGGDPICGFGGEASCAALWDHAAAGAIHRWTGVPVAGWGLVWGLAALTLPLAALRPRAGHEALAAGVRFVAGGGVLSVALLAGVSVHEAIFCAGCAGTYALVLAYAAVAFLRLRGVGQPAPGRGAALAAGVTAAAFLLLLYPGLRTPRSTSEVTREAIAAGGESSRGTAAEGPEAEGAAPQGRWVDRDQFLAEFVKPLDPPVQQLLSNALYQYRSAPVVSAQSPRSLIGPRDAPVRITDFTDILCPACAQLHANLDVFFQALPEGSFSLEPRHFPLDRRCNPVISQQRPEGEVRCLAAKALICMEGRPGAFELHKQLFENQQRLNPYLLYGLADAFIPREELLACIASPGTEAKLRDDINAAQRLGISGTPLVLLNGRKAPTFGAFLYVILLNGGDPASPAFEQLPPPDPEAPVH